MININNSVELSKICYSGDINNEKIIDNYIQTKDKQILLLSQHISFMQETNDLNISIYQKKIKEQEDIINNLINQLKTNTLIFPD